MNNLLARYAECIFWLARYIERAENLARILDVNETFSRDSRGVQELAVDRPAQRRREALFSAGTSRRPPRTSSTSTCSTAEPDLDRVGDPDPRARTPGTLRPLISTEMWAQINVFHNSCWRSARPTSRRAT